MHQTRSGTDGWTDSGINLFLPKFFWGHNNGDQPMAPWGRGKVQ